jgi:signal transduction histidine kinase
MYDECIKDARILIVDDQAGSVQLLENILARIGFTKFRSTTDSRFAFSLFQEFGPDIVLLDLNMPHRSGFEVLKEIKAFLPADAFLPVLVLTGEPTASAKRHALSIGATDLLAKPYDASEVLVRICNLLKARTLHLQVQNQKHELEKIVAERTRDLQQALAELKATQQQLVRQERLHAFSEMAGGVVHDFNNALMAVVGYSDLLLGSPELLSDPAVVLEYLEIMNTSGKDAAHVVSRLRDFYRPRDFSDVFTALDLNKLLEQAVSLTQPKWRDQALAEGREIRVELDMEKLPPVSANEAEIRELVTNLIFNAVDAMPAGGTITLRSSHGRDGVFIEVSDTGVGMSEAVRSRCLEPFFSTKGEKGTGLGLSMVFGIVQRHHGRLDLRSVPGHGTTFSIHFPHGNGETARLEESPAPREPLRILVVDDEPVTRDVVTRYLRFEGHEVTVAANGSDAWAEFVAGNFDLLLTDHAMPGMSGLHLAAAAREARPDLSVILLTGFGHAGLRDGETPEFVDVVISKPVPQAALRKAVAEAVATAARRMNEAPLVAA